MELDMKFEERKPLRTFEVGCNETILKDCVRIELASDEQVTFKTVSGTEYDVVRKSWGYYATPSLNGRLQGFGLRGVLVRNLNAKFYLLLVEEGKEERFQHYLDIEQLTVVCWLDNDKELETLEEKLNSS